MEVTVSIVETGLSADATKDRGAALAETGADTSARASWVADTETAGADSIEAETGLESEEMGAAGAAGEVAIDTGVTEAEEAESLFFFFCFVEEALESFERGLMGEGLYASLEEERVRDQDRKHRVGLSHDDKAADADNDTSSESAGVPT